MSENKHTPGPWRYQEGKIFGPNGTGPLAHALSNSTSIGYFEREKNGAVMAASPDLLEACEELVELIESSDYYNDVTLSKARAAIAKAKGEG